ncbi:MAG: prepilin-type N-terminal cleavage/methylation domain-containing protein [Candidatus Omnitrophota bacterium]|jgi:prepilin-type N-terminal cleavage/methylation domain-containing protein
MILPIGIKKRSRGFTLIEVLITVAVLSVATVFISQGNLLSGAVYGRSVNRLEMQNWAAEKIWKVKEEILGAEFPEVGASSGAVQGKTRAYRWTLDVKEEREKLCTAYEISLAVTWPEGGGEALAERYGAILKVKGK